MVGSWGTEVSAVEGGREERGVKVRVDEGEGGGGETGEVTLFHQEDRCEAARLEK